MDDPAPPTSSKRPRELLLLKLLPNMVSILGLCAGLTAVRFALIGWFELAILLIGTAAVFDGLDGRLARMLKSESAMGAEIDSLGDFVNFGVVPGLVLYLWGLRPETSLGWIAVLVYVVCCMLRLARFNVGIKRADDAAEKTTFVGVPSPAGAMLVLAPMYLTFMLDREITLAAALVALWMVSIGALMISRIRTPSLKRVTVAADHARFVLVAGVALVAAMLTYPWVTLLSLAILYLGGILWLWWRGALKR
ncbi:MAG: CDP-diacylglycerol--serine O-phosphatidyltransferase [Exiguobacterium profundum]|nr:MAG: CDP-diacylglycerol--serine O-phosphatidyltransferase [Exiguobacterium profundum]